MILGDQNGSKAPPGGGQTTLDDIFRLAAARRPEALALLDPPNRAAFTNGTPRRLTYAQTDAAISALAQKLRDTGLPPDSVVAFQLPNCVESIVTLLAILRAGMIAAPLPLLWRRADCVTALSRAGAKALITCSHVGDTRLGDLALQVASELFPIRHVCGFGETLAEIAPLDDIFTQAPGVTVTPLTRDRPAAHVAIVTFETTAEGLAPLARNHVELLAAFLPAVLESVIAHESVLVSLLPVSSFAGIALTVGPWLLSGGTLALHHPFDPQTLSAQLQDMRADHIVLPGPLAARLADAGLLSSGHGLKSVLGVWRTPERLAAAAPWTHAELSLTDVSVFGEIALIATKRHDGVPAPLVPGPQTAPYRTLGAVAVADLTRTVRGTLGVRGPMMPHHAFPPGAAHADALNPDEAGFIDTGFTCRIDAQTGTLIVTGPPAGLVTVGGYRFTLRDLQEDATRVDAQAHLAAFPDAFAGHRLAGQTNDRARMRQALTEAGANPLLVRAFRDRSDARPG